jgi:hypothetical protein
MSTTTTAGQGPGSTSPPADVNRLNAALVQNWWLIALRGVLAVVFGILALAMPVATILALVLLFSAYMLVDAAFSFTRRRSRWVAGSRRFMPAGEDVEVTKLHQTTRTATSTLPRMAFE